MSRSWNNRSLNECHWRLAHPCECSGLLASSLAGKQPVAPGFDKNRTSQTELCHRGFTLVEAVISMVIVAVIVAVSLNTLGGAAKARRVSHSLQRGPALAAQLMAEIMPLAYEEPDDTPSFGPETGEAGGTRNDFDDIDDYHNWSTTPPEDRDGTVIANAAGWKREVTVQHVALTSPSSITFFTTGLRKITVTVTDPRGGETTLVCLRTQYSTYDQAPTADTTIVASVEVQLQVGPDTSTGIASATSVLNWPVTPNAFTSQPVDVKSYPVEYYPTDPYQPAETQ